MIARCVRSVLCPQPVEVVVINVQESEFPTEAAQYVSYRQSLFVNQAPFYHSASSSVSHVPLEPSREMPVNVVASLAMRDGFPTLNKRFVLRKSASRLAFPVKREGNVVVSSSADWFPEKVT